MTWFPSLRSCVNDKLFRQHWASLSPPPPAVPLSCTTSAQLSLQTSIRPTSGDMQSCPRFLNGWKLTSQMHSRISDRQNFLSAATSPRCTSESVRSYACVCVCVFIRGDSSVQWDKESVNHNQKGNGRQSRGGGRGRCASRIFGRDVGHGVQGAGEWSGMCLIWEARAEVPCIQLGTSLLIEWLQELQISLNKTIILIRPLWWCKTVMT